MTEKQLAVFQFIRKYMETHGQSPLIREIQLGCQISSYKSAVDRLNALERKGLIWRLANKHRGIRIGEAEPVSSNIGGVAEGV